MSLMRSVANLINCLRRHDGMMENCIPAPLTVNRSPSFFAKEKLEALPKKFVNRLLHVVNRIIISTNFKKNLPLLLIYAKARIIRERYIIL
jgi:hypothetical protein